MSCIEVPHIGIPDIPGLSLLLGDISIPGPDLGINFCCKFDLPIPGFPIILPLGTLLNTLAANPGQSAVVEAILTTLDQIVSTINTLLDQLPFECPLN